MKLTDVVLGAMQKLVSRSQARAQGSRYYFTGKPCAHGHVAARWTSTATCTACKKRENAKNRNRPRGAYYQAGYKAGKGMPAWLTEEQKQMMMELYEEAARRGEQVDHIVPLTHPHVCGLHVPWNLRILCRNKNGWKHNNLPPRSMYLAITLTSPDVA